MGHYFDRESLLARKRQFEAYAEWEWDHREPVTPDEALAMTAQLCALFPPPDDDDAAFDPSGIAKMREILAHLRSRSHG